MSIQMIYNKCLALGMTKAGAAGCTANIMAESAGRADNLQDSYNVAFGVSDAEYVRQVDAGQRNFIDSAGFGYCQWTSGDRKKAMLSYFREHGKSIADSDTQFQFMAREMRNTYSHVWYILTSTNDPYEAGYTMCKFYEIPADTEAQAKYRGNEAVKIFNGLSGKAEEKPAAPSYWPPRMIDKNMSGPDVEVLQAVLKARGYGINFISGKFDELLDGAVRSFQEDNGLAVDGVVGPNTWAVLLGR